MRDVLFRAADPYVDAIERTHRRLTGAGSVRALVQYQRDPIGFAVDVLSIPEHTLVWSQNPGYESHTWDGTPDPIAAFLCALADNEDVGIESATGTGKSFALAIATCWFLGSFEGARVFTFAPTEEQLRIYSWTELRAKLWPRFHARFPHATLDDLRLRMIPGSDEWAAIGRSVQIRAGEDVSSRAAGMHSPHQLLLYEEGQGIDPSVYAAGENTSTGGHNLRAAVGNPDHEFDGLHQFCTSPGVRPIRISAYDHPNVVLGQEIIPGAVTRRSIERRRARYGEDHPLYQSRVRGIARSESASSLIKMADIRRAVERWKDPEARERLMEGGFPALGVDPANSEKGDPAGIAHGIGAVCTKIEAIRCPRADHLGVRIAAEIAVAGINPRHVGVDAGGVGASTVNKLLELGLYVEALHSGGKARPSVDEDLLREKGKTVAIVELFLNLRAQMWWQLALDLMHDRIAIPDDPELHEELLALEWTDKGGVIRVESKDEPLPGSKYRHNLIERLGRSPNKADALVYWNFVRHRRAVPEKPEPASAWDRDIIEHEARESRRIKPRRPARRANDPFILEHVE